MAAYGVPRFAIDGRDVGDEAHRNFIDHNKAQKSTARENAPLKAATRRTAANNGEDGLLIEGV